MNLEETALAYASVTGRLRGVISGILKWSSDEISPSVKKTLEEALKYAEDKLEIPEEDRRL
jgi:hypothetical protein